MTSLAARFQTLNPVLDRELRQRSRSARSIILLTLLLAALTAVLFVTHLTATQTVDNGFDGFQNFGSSRAGSQMFESVLFAELALLLLIIPGVSASAISGERDRQTLVPLQVTLLGRFGIFFGKVGASSAFVLLLITASAPLLAIPYLVGGVGLDRILLGLFTTLASGIIYAALGVACSAFFRRTQTATLMTYLIVFLSIFGSVVSYAVIRDVQQAREDFSPPTVVPLLFNPFVGVADAAGKIDQDYGQLGPFSEFKRVLVEDQFRNEEIFFDAEFEPGFVNPGQALETDKPYWLYSLLLQAGFTAMFVVGGLVKLRLPRKEVD